MNHKSDVESVGDSTDIKNVCVAQKGLKTISICG